MVKDRCISRSVLAASLSLGLLATPGCSPFYVPPPDDCSNEKQNEFVYDAMANSYLWNNELPPKEEVDFNASEPADFVRTLRHQEFDRWSRVSDQSTSDALFMDGKFIGLGFSHRRDSNGRIRVSFVHAGSPADLAGIRRGDEVTAINSVRIATIDEDGLWGEIFGPNDLGETTEVSTLKADGTAADFVLERSWVDIALVPATNIVNHDGHTYGYLNFATFVGAGSDALDDAFEEFGEAEVDALIVDLRYNGGGLLSIARHFINLIAGATTGGGVVAYDVEYNPNLADNNESHDISDPKRSIPLDHVVFITTRSTLSASELVMNSVRAHMPIYVVGSRTGGKPVGSKHYDFCDKTLFPITFRLRNAKGESDYFEGLSPDCELDDDFDHALGDPNEAGFAAALNVAKGVCPAVDEDGLPPPQVPRSNAPADSDRILSTDPLARIAGSL
ncbi:MAG: S41 family peptidase [Nannocystaceae bacterium]